MKAQLFSLALALSLAVAISSNYREICCSVCGYRTYCFEYEGRPVCCYCGPLLGTDAGAPGAQFRPEPPSNPILDDVDLSVEEP